MPPVLFIVGLALSFALGKSTSQHVKVVHINDQEVRESKVLGPILVVEEDGRIASVRSGFSLKGEYHPRTIFRGNGDADIFDISDAALREVRLAGKKNPSPTR